MQRLSIAVSLSVVCACAQNKFPLQPAQGAAEIEWVSASSFRFARSWSGPTPLRAPASSTEVEVKRAEVEGRIRFTTRYLTVDVDKDGGRVDVRSDLGPLTSSALRRDGATPVMESSAGNGERFYGLGSRRTPKLDLRGATIRAGRAFLLSSAGFAEFFPGCLGCMFDLGAQKPDRWTVKVRDDTIEYYFYYGPSPREVWEEHLGATRDVDTFDSTDLRIRLQPASATARSWENLRETVYEFEHESLSAMLTPSFDLGPYQAAGGELVARAAQLAAYIPRLRSAPGAGAAWDAMFSWRARLKPYVEAYGYETRSRGAPLIHPLAAHFPKDAEAARHSDEFMVGDELLVAPVLRPGETIPVYLPQGLWTELHSNERYKGKQEISIRVRPDDIPVFARNGSIVPLAPAADDAPTELHYFPKLGGEFFLYEEDLEDFTQVHAAPADEFMRLEIESRKERTYEWVVHHTPVCRRVALGEQEFARAESAARLAPGAWYYDAGRQSLHVRVRAKENGDEIVNVTF